MLAGEPFSTSEDHFLGGRLVIRQPVNGYRAGSDPMFLAAAVPARGGDHVLDVGCGVGTASLCLLARVEGVRVTGLELQPGLAGLARANAEANGFAGRLEVAEGCLTEPPAAESKAIGHMEEVELALWLKQAVRFLKPKGRLFVVHRADRLGDILAGLAPLKVGEVRVFPLWPKQGKAATRVVVAARKDAKTPLEVLPGLLLHHPDGSYTDKADDVLRRGAALF